MSSRPPPLQKQTSREANRGDTACGVAKRPPAAPPAGPTGPPRPPSAAAALEDNSAAGVAAAAMAPAAAAATCGAAPAAQVRITAAQLLKAQRLRKLRALLQHKPPAAPPAADLDLLASAALGA